MTYKCTSDQCRCKAVPAKTFENGWECLECGARYIYRQSSPPPLVNIPGFTPEDRVLADFRRIPAENQRDLVQAILKRHAHDLGEACLSFFELNIQEMLNEYNGAKGDPCKK